MRTSLFVSKALLIFFIANSVLTLAQDYPYDDVELKKDEGPLPVEKDSIEKTDPKDPSSPATKKTARRLGPLYRVGIKVGGNFGVFQNPSATNPILTTTTKGVGFDALLAFGWDLPYQPLFIEFETGYRNQFLSTGSPLHAIPLLIGFHYRSRLGRTALFKPGFESGLDARIASETDEVTGIKSTSFGVFPVVSLSLLFENGAFLIEPLFTIGRIQSQNNFFVAALRTGLRF